MTDAPETDASFLAPVSGACVMGIPQQKQMCADKPRDAGTQNERSN